MPDSDRLRERAARLFALAISARESGFAGADELEQMGHEALAQAEEMDRAAEPPAMGSHTEDLILQQQQQQQHVGQQQQQPQDDPGKKE